MSTVRIKNETLKEIVKSVILDLIEEDDDFLYQLIQDVRVEVVKEVTDDIKQILAKYKGNMGTNSVPNRTQQNRQQPKPVVAAPKKRPSIYEDPLSYVFEEEGLGGDSGSSSGESDINYHGMHQSGYSDVQNVVSSMGGYGYGGGYGGGGGGGSHGSDSVPRNAKKGFASFFEGTDPIPDDPMEMMEQQYKQDLVMRRQMAAQQNNNMPEPTNHSQALSAPLQQSRYANILNETAMGNAGMAMDFDPSTSMIPPSMMMNEVPQYESSQPPMPMMEYNRPQPQVAQRNTQEYSSHQPSFDPSMLVPSNPMNNLAPPTMPNRPSSISSMELSDSSPISRLHKLNMQPVPADNRFNMSAAERRIQEKLSAPSMSRPIANLGYNPMELNADAMKMMRDPT
jgi:hypothetical protein